MVAKTWRKGWATDADAEFTPQAGEAPLFIAAYLGKEAVVRLLLQAEADKDVKDKVRAKRGRGEAG